MPVAGKAFDATYIYFHTKAASYRYADSPNQTQYVIAAGGGVAADLFGGIVTPLGAVYGGAFIGGACCTPLGAGIGGFLGYLSGVFLYERYGSDRVKDGTTYAIYSTISNQ